MLQNINELNYLLTRDFFTDERSYKALSDLFGPSNAASSEPLTNAPKVTNQQHSQNNTLGSQRQHAQAASKSEVNTSNVGAEISNETAIRSATPVMETVSTWGGPNRISGAIRKTPCAIKNSKFNSLPKSAIV
jgi:CCR4-NOT transcriptional regulation complex NOT5 subunit